MVEVIVSLANGEQTGEKKGKFMHFTSCCKIHCLEIQHKTVSDQPNISSITLSDCRHGNHILLKFTGLILLILFVCSLHATFVAKYESKMIFIE